MKVCIIGSGLSALTLAKALVNQNIFVDILPLNKNYIPNKSRTIGISKSNLDYFNNEIINIKKIIWKLKKIQIYSDNLMNEKLLNFENNDQLFSIVKNSQIYEILNKSLLSNKFYRKIKFTKKIKNLESYNLIVNTDYKSFFTKKFFSKKIVKVYDSLAYTTILDHKNISNNIAIQIFTKRGPLAFLPISKNKTSIVYSIYKSKNNKKKLDLEKLIHHYNLKYKIKKIHKVESFQLRSFNLRSYYYENILAFGDLLHTIHPLAGQGFNMTIRDVKVLINIIKQKINLGLPLDISVNKEFEKKIRHKNYIFSNSIDFIQEFFNFERKINNSILSKSVQVIGKNTSIKNFIINIADNGINY